MDLNLPSYCKEFKKQQETISKHEIFGTLELESLQVLKFGKGWGQAIRIVFGEVVTTGVNHRFRKQNGKLT